MALNASIHWGLILRVDVPQAITQDGWKYLLAQARYPFNFDGEIFGLHSTMAEQLREFELSQSIFAAVIIFLTC